MQRFYSQSATIQARPEQVGVDSVDVTDKKPITSGQQQSQPSVTMPNNKVRSTLKRLMVPELAPPHHEQLISYEAKEIPAQKADKIDPILENNQSEYQPKAYQPDQIAQDFKANQNSPTHHSSKWLWVALVLFLLSAAGLAALYIFYR